MCASIVLFILVFASLRLCVLWFFGRVQGESIPAGAKVQSNRRTVGVSALHTQHNTAIA